MLRLLSLICCTLTLTACIANAQPAAEPVPEYSVAPTAPRQYYDVPTVNATSGPDGEIITIKNYALSATITVDKDMLVSLTSLKTEYGRELLAKPSPCFSIVDGEGKAWRDGSKFKLAKWSMWLHNVDAEVELKLLAPEPVIWRLKTYRDKPYLEMRFETPYGWRTLDRVLVQTLATDPALRPVMPNNLMKRGFTNGMPNLTGRHRFEFVEKSEHMLYSADSHSGLVAFIAGVGGEESLTKGEVKLLDHATPSLGDDDPLGRALLFPFDGPVEKGFATVRKFVGHEYARQGDKYADMLWNQFWLWQWSFPNWGYEQFTAKRIMDILPHLNAIGVETVQLDAGWEKNYQEWVFDPVRFPDGFGPIHDYIRSHGMAYKTRTSGRLVDDPDVILRIVKETDLDKLFMDAPTDETTISKLRKVRKVYPSLEVLPHAMHDARRAGSYWFWGNIHYLSDIDMVYFGESNILSWLSKLKPDRNVIRVADLVTRAGAYQANWVWPYKCVLSPHAGWTIANQPGTPQRYPDMGIPELSSLMTTTLAAQYTFQWGDDPRLLKPEILDYFLNWVAFFKTIRPTLVEYQHILPPPDGLNPDGTAHIINGKGLVFLFNPGDKPAKVSWKEVFWSPELEMDPRTPVELTEWADPMKPTKVATLDLAKPKGEITLQPLSQRVIGVNLDVESVKTEVKRQRSLLTWPPK